MTDLCHRVHGVGTDEVPADWPPLTTAEVSAVLARLPAVGQPQTLLWHSPRPLSAAALVGTPGGELFVKRHHRSVRTPATLLEEHRLMAHLRQRGFPVATLLSDDAGRSSWALGDWTYEVYRRGTGLDLYRETTSWTPLRDLPRAYHAGAMLARLHQAADGYQAPQRSTHILVTRDDLLRAEDPVDALEKQLPNRPGLAVYLSKRDWRHEWRKQLLPWHAGLAGRVARQPPLWTHNDWHVSNLLWSEDSDQATVSTVLDFGLASPTCALFDLATAIERNAIAWLALEQGMHAAHLDTARALIAGYQAVRPLNAEQLDLLADLLPLVHLDFALSEVEYFQAITNALANADVAYETFLLGHAQWFASAAGEAMRQAVRQCPAQAGG